MSLISVPKKQPVLRERPWRHALEYSPPTGAHVELSWDRIDAFVTVNWYRQDYGDITGLFWRYVSESYD